MVIIQEEGGNKYNCYCIFYLGGGKYQEKPSILMALKVIYNTYGVYVDL